ncbi:MAG TPA: DNA-protecting protein DprA [Firmicutes bacterium]|nr:DNA-protecting protein DprA [Bacillota bacterium]
MISWIELSRHPLKASDKVKLLRELGDPASVLEYLDKETQLPLFTPDHVYNPEEELTRVKSLGAELITYFDNDYPELLREIFDPPVLLYIKGDRTLLQNFSIGIVGTRKPTEYGVSATHYFVEALVTGGITITSGLAIGCDAVAHQTALMKSGKTIGVLGTGIDKIYPSSNRRIFQKMYESGLVISEFSLGTPSLPRNFPLRNRIISGISHGTLVIEAGDWSGSLITAYNSLNQGREVFAVPGNIFSGMSKGCHRLIQQGAKLITSPQDVFEEFEHLDIFKCNPVCHSKKEISSDARAILNILESGPAEFDDICTKTNFQPGYVLGLLTELEINNYLLKIDGSSYGKKE